MAIVPGLTSLSLTHRFDTLVLFAGRFSLAVKYRYNHHPNHHRTEPDRQATSCRSSEEISID